MANKTIHTLITKFFGNDLPDAIQMSFRKWFVGGTHQQEKEEAMRELWEQVPSEAAVINVKMYRQITEPEDWAQIGLDPASNYQLEADIDLSKVPTDQMVVKGSFTGE